MPAASEFIKALRSIGIHECEFAYGNRWWDAELVVEHGAKAGAKRDALLTALVGATEQTRALTAANLPHSRSALTSQRLTCSSFVRLVAGERNHRSMRGIREMNAIIHAEFSFDADCDLEPIIVGVADGAPGSVLTMTTRILDVHVQNVPDDRRSAVYAVLGAALGEQMMGHLVGPCEALYRLVDDFDDVDAPYFGRGRLELALQGDTCELGVSQVMDACAASFLRACADGQDNACRLFSLDEGALLSLARTDVALEDAIAECVTSRRSSAKPKRARAGVNELHHFLIGTDPTLRVSKGKVVNLGVLAWGQTLAREQAAAASGEDARSFADGDVYARRNEQEARVAKMRGNPDMDPLRWLFLVDDATRVFSAYPFAASELDAGSALVWMMTQAWMGNHGLLRGPPKCVSIPCAYMGGPARASIADALDKRGVTLVQPSSGFSAPIHVVKAWCQQTMWIEQYQHPGERRKAAPSIMPLKFVQDWSFAHLLAEHANSYFGDPTESGNAGKSFGFAGGGFGVLKTMGVETYAKAVGIGDVEGFLKEWRQRCEPVFMSMPWRGEVLDQLQQGSDKPQAP